MIERPKPTAHPVDVLKWCAEQMGREFEPESEARLRAICDEPVAVDPFVLGDREHWVPVEGFPEPTRVVEYRGTTLRSRVKVEGYLIDAALGEG